MVELGQELQAQYPNLGFEEGKTSAAGVPTYTNPDLSGFHPTCKLQAKGCTGISGAWLLHPEGGSTSSPIEEIRGAIYPSCAACPVSSG